MTSSIILPEWMNNAISALKQGNLDSYMEIYSPDAIHEFPFAADDEVHQLKGKPAIRNYISDILAKISFGQFNVISARVLENELIVEATGIHQLKETDLSIQIDYVWFISHEGGVVNHMRDYMKFTPLS